MALPRSVCFLVVNLSSLLTFYTVVCYSSADSCKEMKCQVLEERDYSSEFRFKASEEGVRLVYLNFKIFNDGYDPPVPKNRILPYRWTWAQSVSESMLALSYDYDVLSLGLLKNQVRSIMVTLKETQDGCFAHLTPPCQDITLATSLLNFTRNLTTSKPPDEINGVVCFRVVEEFSFGVGGSFKYQCCKQSGEQRGKRKPIHCGFDVIESKWLLVFNYILNVVVSVVFLYWPLLFCAIPEYFFNGIRQKRQIPEEIPVDDSSPITFAVIVSKCAERLTFLKHGLNVKLILLWYCVLPIIFYVKLALYFIIKGNFDDASGKLLFQVGDYYLHIFDMKKPVVYVLFILPLFTIPTVIFFFLRPEGANLQTSKCSLCETEGILTPQKEVQKHVKVIPSRVMQVMETVLGQFTNSKCELCRNTAHMPSQHSPCGHAICVLGSVASAIVVCPLAIVFTFLIFLLVSVVCLVLYSPLLCLLQISFRFIHRRFFYKSLFFLIFLYSSLSLFIVVIFSSQFVVRMFGFVVMGIILNAEFAIPFVTFFFVVWRNIYLCYSNLQNRYKEVKTMISEQWKEISKEKMIPYEEDTIPTALFLFVCNKRRVLPIADEVFLMLCSVLAILMFLSIALAAIFLFKVAYTSSAVVSTIAVFVSGKISEMFFSRVTTGYSISGWEKIRKKESIQLAVEEFQNIYFSSESHWVSMESDISYVSRLTTV